MIVHNIKFLVEILFLLKFPDKNPYNYKSRYQKRYRGYYTIDYQYFVNSLRDTIISFGASISLAMLCSVSSDSMVPVIHPARWPKNYTIAVFGIFRNSKNAMSMVTIAAIKSAIGPT